MADDYQPAEPDPNAVEVETTPNLAGYDPRAANLVPFFMAAGDDGKKILSDLAKQVYDDFQRGWDGAEEYRTRREQNERILTGFLRQKDLPFAGCANAHTPLMLERLLRLEANTFVEIFMERDTIFGVKPTGSHPEEMEEAELLTFHGNWQIQNELTDFLPQQQRAVHEFFSVGSVFCHSYRDEVRNRNRHDILSCDEFVIPYVWTTVEVDLSDVPWKAKILRRYRQEIEELRDSGKWDNVDEILKNKPPAWEAGPEARVRDLGAKREGIVAPESDPNAPYKFIEYHGWFTMPGQKRMSPVCATVDYSSKAVTKFYLREEEDWRDRARFDAQKQDAEQYARDHGDHAAARDTEMQLRGRMTEPDVSPEERQQIEQALAAEQLQPPVPPGWSQQQPGAPPESVAPEPVRMVPIENFSHGKCWDVTGRALGLSFGQVLADLNRLADESYNRLYDAATLANCWSMIMADGLDLGANSIPFGPGKVLRVKLQSGDDLNRMIKELKPAPANPQLMDVVRYAHDNADSAVAAPGVLSGEPGKSGETFRGISTRVERATRQLSMAGIKYLGFLEQILRNNAKLNALFMPDEEVVEMADLLDLPSQRPGQVGQVVAPGIRKMTVGRNMYRRSYNVTFTADVRFASQSQRVAEADEIVAMLQAIPPLQQNPAFAYAAISGALRARGRRDLVQALGPAPEAPTVPFGSPPPPPPGMPPVVPGQGPNTTTTAPPPMGNA